MCGRSIARGALGALVMTIAMWSAAPFALAGGLCAASAVVVLFAYRRNTLKPAAGSGPADPLPSINVQ